MNYIGNSRKLKRKKNSRIFQIVIIVIAVIISIYLLAQMKLPILSDISGAVVSRSKRCSKHGKRSNN